MEDVDSIGFVVRRWIRRSPGIVERQQLLSVVGDLRDGLRGLRAVGAGERIDRLPGVARSSVLRVSCIAFLRAGMSGPRSGIRDIPSPVDPAPLLPCSRDNLSQGTPRPHREVVGHEFEVARVTSAADLQPHVWDMASPSPTAFSAGSPAAAAEWRNCSSAGANSPEDKQWR